MEDRANIRRIISEYREHGKYPIPDEARERMVYDLSTMILSGDAELKLKAMQMLATLERNNQRSEALRIKGEQGAPVPQVNVFGGISDAIREILSDDEKRSQVIEAKIEDDDE